MPIHFTHFAMSRALTAGALLFAFCLNADVWADGQPSRAVHGMVVGVDLKAGTVDLEFACRQLPKVGDRMCVSRKYVFETVGRGEVEVVYLANTQIALARPVGRLGITDISKGDFVRTKRASQPKPETNADESVIQRKPAGNAKTPATTLIKQSEPADPSVALATESVTQSKPADPSDAPATEPIKQSRPADNADAPATESVSQSKPADPSDAPATESVTQSKPANPSDAPAAESVTQSKPADNADARATESVTQSKSADPSDARAAKSTVRFVSPNLIKLVAGRTQPKPTTEAAPARRVEVKQAVRLLVPRQVR